MSDKNYGICTPGCFNQGAKLVSALVIADVAEQSDNDIILFNDQAVIGVHSGMIKSIKNSSFS